MKKINKKGTSDVDNIVVKKLTLIAEIVVAVMILVGAGSIAIKNMQDAENFVIAKDVAFLVETISSSPYDLTYAYPVNIEKKAIQIENESVTVFSSKRTVVEPFVPLQNIKISESFIRNTLALIFYLEKDNLKFGDSTDIKGENYCNLLPVISKEDPKILVSVSVQSEYLQKIKETMKIANKNSDGFKIEETFSPDITIELGFNQENNLSIKHNPENTGFTRISCYLYDGLERTGNFNSSSETEDVSNENKISILLGSIEGLKEKLNSEEQTDLLVEMEKYGIILIESLKKGVKNTE